MTMTTTVRIDAAVPPRELLTYVTKLVNFDDIAVPEPSESEDDGVVTLMNPGGIGLHALCWVKYAEMLPIRDEYSDPDSQDAPRGSVEVSFDTIYGYQEFDTLAHCGDLHHALILAIRDWLGKRGIPPERAWWRAGEYSPTPSRQGWFNGNLADLSTQTGDPRKVRFTNA